MSPLSEAVRVPTGVRRLDELLKGGIPQNDFALVYGAPFIGKEVLGRQFLTEGVAEGQAGIMVLTNHAASDVRSEFTKSLNGTYTEAEEKGLMQYVDIYSDSIGAAEPASNIQYIESLMDLNAVSAAVNGLQSRILPDSPQHRLVFDSISTLAAYTNPQTTFRFLQVFLGRARRAGATGMILLDEGMNTEAEMRMFRHLVDGVIEVKEEAGKLVLHVDGLGCTESRGWVEYRFDDARLEITGSFAAGRIR